MADLKFTAERIAKFFNVPVENVKRQFADNAKAFLDMAEKAKENGGKCNGYTEAELRKLYTEYLEKSK